MLSPGLNLENREYARILAETADLMEISGEDSFRIRSYRNGATAIEGYPERIEEILGNPDRKITEIPGIGKGLAAILGEIRASGSFEIRERLLTKYPPTALEFLKIQGLGPKTIALLFEHFQVATMDDLERLCREEKIRDLPRLGAKTEEKILRSIEQYRLRTGRFLLSFGEGVASELMAFLSDVEGITSIIPAGSLRRGKETIGDLDLLVTGPGAAAALEKAATFPRIHEVLGRGPNKLSVKIGREALQVDIRALADESRGAAMQYFTGSKEHNVAVRIRAVKMGFKLSEYGLFRIEDDSRAAGDTEEGVYAALGLQWMPPEMRENTGELELAAEGALPRLIELADMRGDLHMHTTATDGRATLEEMAEAACARGLEYIAITDHSKAIAMSFGLDEARVESFAAQVREINASGHLGIHVFAGIECDILRDGALDLAWDALAQLDFVIGSVHSSMTMESAEMTDRLLRALECPHLRLLGHPTGRLLMHRDPYPYDFDRVVTEAVKRGVALEINASPERLDLNAHLVRTAKAKGAKFCIDTDAHHPKALANLRYGVFTARRGWLQREDVLNTRPLAEFRNAIARM
jgi:DNA polymerase (family 10)